MSREVEGLFSPMDNSNSSDASLQLGSALTPKRRLSMDLDESTQDSSDSGFIRSCSTSLCSSQESSLSSSQHSSSQYSSQHSSHLSSLSEALEATIARDTSARTPLGELPINLNHRKTLHARRAKAKRSISFACEQEKDEKTSPSIEPPRHSFPRPSSLPSFPSLPCSPLTHNTAEPSHRPSPVHQISSPLERMSLMSPMATGVQAKPLSSHSKPPAHSTPTSAFASFPHSDSWTPLVQEKRGSLKRTSPCAESTQQQKRKRLPLPVFGSNSQDSTVRHSPPLKGVQLLRSQSCSEASVEHFVYSISPGSDNGEMIGDRSKPYALPAVKSKIPDLKCIAPCTLAELLTRSQAILVDDFCVVDCRYPYEYQGGHIQGALNIWQKSELLEHFFIQPQYMAENKRRVVIFHCEFSSKRGPEMSRFMRKTDRDKNGMLSFPKLYYPELYLLDGGYKAFYEKYPELCEPNCYVTMLDDKHKEALRHFKIRSKSWNDGDGPSNKRRNGHMRPRRSTIDSSLSTS